MRRATTCNQSATVLELLLVLAPLVCAQTIFGQSSDDGGAGAQEKAQTQKVFLGSVDSVLNNLSDLRISRNAMTRFDPFTLLKDETRKLNNRLDKAANLRVGFAWTGLYQYASKAMGPNDAAGGDFDFFGRWRPLHNRETMGYLIFSTEMRYDLFTDITPSALAESIGSLWGTTSGFNQKSFELKELFWQQFLLKNTLTYRVGKLNLDDTFDTNRLKSANYFFLNSAFSDNPTIAYPDNGFGADTTWRPNRSIYLSAGITDADADSIDLDSDKNLLDASWFTALELGYTPWIDDLGPGHYRFMAWYTQAQASADESGDWGLSLSFDQDLGPRLLGFLRGAYSRGTLTDTRGIVAGGIGFKAPLSKAADFAGIAASWGTPSDGTLRDQWAFEAFYRFQLTPAIQVTPDAQFIVNPSLAPNVDSVWVFSIRVRISF